MKSFLIAVVLAVALGAGAWFMLERDFQQTAEAAFSTTGVRL
jgi:hypothetical protein